MQVQPFTLGIHIIGLDSQKYIQHDILHLISYKPCIVSKHLRDFTLVTLQYYTCLHHLTRQTATKKYQICTELQTKFYDAKRRRSDVWVDFYRTKMVIVSSDLYIWVWCTLHLTSTRFMLGYILIANLSTYQDKRKKCPQNDKNYNPIRKNSEEST